MTSADQPCLAFDQTGGSIFEKTSVAWSCHEWTGVAPRCNRADLLAKNGRRLVDGAFPAGTIESVGLNERSPDARHPAKRQRAAGDHGNRAFANKNRPAGVQPDGPAVWTVSESQGRNQTLEQPPPCFG